MDGLYVLQVASIAVVAILALSFFSKISLKAELVFQEMHSFPENQFVTLDQIQRTIKWAYQGAIVSALCTLIKMGRVEKDNGPRGEVYRIIPAKRWVSNALK